MLTANYASKILLFSGFEIVLEEAEYSLNNSV